jgi:hypothetical protein
MHAYRTLVPGGHFASLRTARMKLLRRDKLGLSVYIVRRFHQTSLVRAILQVALYSGFCCAFGC